MSAFADRLARHGYILAIVVIVASTAVFLPGRGYFAKGQWALFYLLIILLVASASGAGPAMLAAVLAFFAWNFFFLPPYHTLEIRDPKDWLSLVAFLVVGMIVGLQAGRMREREARAIAREQETAALNRLSAELASQTSTSHMAERFLAESLELLGASSATLFVAGDHGLEAFCTSPPCDAADPDVARRATLAFAEGGEAGGQPASTQPGSTRPGTAAGDGGLYVPVRSPSGVNGVLTATARPGGPAYSPDDTRLATSLANLVGVFLDRQRLQAAGDASGGRARGRPAQVEPAVVGVPRAQDAAGRAHGHRQQPARERRAVGRAERARRAARHRRRTSTRLNNSIGALLDLSRLEARSWEPRRETYDLSRHHRSGIDTLPAARARPSRRGPARRPAPVAWTIAQLDTGAAEPARERHPVRGPDSVITVGAAAAEGGGYDLWVEDEGPGIPLDEHEAVFEKFYRGRRAGAKVPSGTGLGLAIAREIVRAHGGVISVEDVEPHGARFVIAMPGSTRHAAAGGHMSIPERPTHILVVDDEEQIRRALKSILHYRGYVLDIATTGQEALLHAIDAPAGPRRSWTSACRT